MVEHITIIMPVFNAEPFLAEAIGSVLAQTHKNFTLIIVNDGSTDCSTDIIASYAAADPRIKVIDQPSNLGISNATNRALHEAGTEWVFLMDADDVMLPNRLERQLEFIGTNPDLRACSCRAHYIDSEGRTLGKTHNSVPNVEAFERYVRNGEAIGLLNPGAAIHRETALSVGAYRSQFDPAHDIDFWNRLAEAGHLILVQNEALMKYRIHPQSQVTSRFLYTRMQLEWVRACMRARQNGEPEPTREEFLSNWRSAPVLRRINMWRKIKSEACYRSAGLNAISRNPVRTGALFGVALLLWPGYAIRRFINQVVL